MVTKPSSLPYLEHGLALRCREKRLSAAKEPVTKSVLWSSLILHLREFQGHWLRIHRHLRYSCFLVHLVSLKHSNQKQPIRRTRSMRDRFPDGSNTGREIWQPEREGEEDVTALLLGDTWCGNILFHIPG